MSHFKKKQAQKSEMVKRHFEQIERQNKMNEVFKPKPIALMVNRIIRNPNSEFYK